MGTKRRIYSITTAVVMAIQGIHVQKGLAQLAPPGGNNPGCQSGPGGEAAREVLIVDPSQGSGHRTIQSALRAARPGTAIRIRGNAPYTETLTLTTSGAPGLPIIIEADRGHAPILTGSGSGPVLTIQDASWITVRGLTFDGQKNTRAKQAIMVRAKTRDINTVTITGNTFKDWMHIQKVRTAGVLVTRHYPHATNNVMVQCNTFDGGNQAVEVNGTNAIVEHNMIRNVGCSEGYHDAVFRVSNTSGIQSAGQRETVTVDQLIFRQNTVTDVDSGCASGGNPIEGFWCDVGVSGGHIVSNVFTMPAKSRSGIHVESRCNNWLVSGNHVTIIGTDPYTSALRHRWNEGTIWENNTVCGGERGMWGLQNEGKAYTVRGNRFHGNPRPLAVSQAVVNGITVPDGGAGDENLMREVLQRGGNTWNPESTDCPAPPTLTVYNIVLEYVETPQDKNVTLAWRYEPAPGPTQTSFELSVYSTTQQSNRPQLFAIPREDATSCDGIVTESRKQFCTRIPCPGIGVYTFFIQEQRENEPGVLSNAVACSIQSTESCACIPLDRGGVIVAGGGNIVPPRPAPVVPTAPPPPTTTVS